MILWRKWKARTRFFVFTRCGHKTLGHVLEKQAVRLGELPFCRFEDEVISYAAFNRRVNRRANFFLARGVGRGDVVCLMMENRPEFLETVAALAKLGAITAATNTHLGGESLVNSIKVTAATRAVVGTECLAAFKAVQPALESIPPGELYVDERWEMDVAPPAGSHDLNRLLPEAGEDNPPPNGCTNRDTLIYINTSGTTGLPKAARGSHLRWLRGSLTLGSVVLGLKPGETHYCPLPLYHSMAFAGGFGAVLVNGATLALSRRFSAGGFWEEVCRLEATRIVYIGELFRYLVNSPPSAHERAHKVSAVVGAGLRPDIWDAVHERFGIRDIREFYAATEGNATTFNLVNRKGSVGKPLGADNLVLVRYDVESGGHPRDEQGFLLRCEAGEQGELLGEITAGAPFTGYTDREATEKKILRDVLQKGDAYYRTGDLLTRDRQGFYYFHDRIGDTYRWKGENVSTQEVQEILAGFPGIGMVSVFGVTVPDAEGRVGMAAPRMEAGREFDPPAFYRHVAQRLPAYARPAFVRLMPEQIMTTTLKYRKSELARQGYDPAQVADRLFYRDDGAETYLPLDGEAMGRIAGGELRF